MKLAFVLTGGLHPSGRVEVVPVWITFLEHLAARHDVHAFVVRHLQRPQSYELRGFHVHDLGSPGSGGVLGRVAQWRALMRALRRHGPFDVIHGVWANPGGLLSVFAGKRLGIPSVVTCDSGEFTALPEIGYGLQSTRTGRAISRVVAGMATRLHVTTKHMQQLAMMHGWHPTRIPVGIDVARFARQSMPPDGPPWRLLTIGSVNRVKHHRLLIDAVAMLRRELDIELDVIGEDTLGGELRAHAESLTVARHVHFHGFVPHDELLPFFERAHLYVQSSLHEAAGVAVLEAAAAGVPIIGTNVGYVADFAPSAAVAVPPGDAEALAAAIKGTLRNPARAAIAAKAHDFVVEHDVGWSVATVEKLYENLMAG